VYFFCDYTTSIEIDPQSNGILHMSTSIKMEDKSSKQSDNMDRDFANEAGSSDSKILVNVWTMTSKEKKQQSSPIILSPLENTINIIS